ncbi:hypothetical protein CkaCkLH20_03902 [Colletotrichum karsti]|uniref:Uncharacterized protein n=1 Tax=Colletotrichum karsti TaxID=1095194 RepID=A0A9P6IGJ9_9PEZI|nr:uncharacterized protein CkaCkLH20_03902 [Colletotrichum karsti]KAF9878410.1 hypothetical protein CkaCkLH20_03902 [Colletotrichum karsti]
MPWWDRKKHMQNKNNWRTNPYPVRESPAGARSDEARVKVEQEPDICDEAREARFFIDTRRGGVPVHHEEPSGVREQPRTRSGAEERTAFNGFAEERLIQEQLGHERLEPGLQEFEPGHREFKRADYVETERWTAYREPEGGDGDSDMYDADPDVQTPGHEDEEYEDDTVGTIIVQQDSMEGEHEEDHEGEQHLSGGEDYISVGEEPVSEGEGHFDEAVEEVSEEEEPPAPTRRITRGYLRSSKSNAA